MDKSVGDNALPETLFNYHEAGHKVGSELVATLLAPPFQSMRMQAEPTNIVQLQHVWKDQDSVLRQESAYVHN